MYVFNSFINNQNLKQMINNKKKKEYSAPEMEVLKARVERGFTTSGTEMPTSEYGNRYNEGEEIGGRFRYN